MEHSSDACVEMEFTRETSDPRQLVLGSPFRALDQERCMWTRPKISGPHDEPQPLGASKVGRNRQLLFICFTRYCH